MIKLDIKQLVGWILVVGALNWGLTALGMNVVEMILGEGGILTKVVYGVIGLAGAYKAYMMVSKGKK